MCTSLVSWGSQGVYVMNGGVLSFFFSLSSGVCGHDVNV